MAIRLDAARAKKWEKLSTGFLRAPASLTRVGVFPYKTKTGETRLELRSEEEVFHPDSIQSFEQLPIVVEHPAEMLVTSENAHRYAKGNVGEKLERDGDKLAGNLMVTHEDAIKGIESGKTAEISLGYTCDLISEPGIWKGQKYTHRQVNIRGNHVALTAKGRMGSDVRVHMDSEDAIAPDLEASASPTPIRTRSTATMEQVTINGVVVEVSTTAAQLLKAERTARGDSAAELVESKKAAEAAAAKIAVLEKAFADSNSVERLDALVSDRTNLFESAKSVLGAEFKGEGKDAKALKLEVLAKLLPDMKLDSASDVAISASFETAVALHKKAPTARGDSASAQVARAAAAAGSASSTSPVEAAYVEMQGRRADAWRKPIGHTLAK